MYVKIFGWDWYNIRVYHYVVKLLKGLLKFMQGEGKYKATKKRETKIGN